MSSVKDVLEGFDVLSLFGKKEQFINGIRTGSDAIEKPKFRLNYIKKLLRLWHSMCKYILSITGACMGGATCTW